MAAPRRGGGRSRRTCLPARRLRGRGRSGPARGRPRRGRRAVGEREAGCASNHSAISAAVRRPSITSAAGRSRGRGGGRRDGPPARGVAVEQDPDRTAPLPGWPSHGTGAGVQPKLAGRPRAMPEPPVISGRSAAARPMATRSASRSASTTIRRWPCACWASSAAAMRSGLQRPPPRGHGRRNGASGGRASGGCRDRSWA